MFGFGKNEKSEIEKVLKSLVKNEIAILLCEGKHDGAIYKSKFGGKPAVPAMFEWPHFEAESYTGETADRPLSFMCQINLEDISRYDKENLLPKSGILLFFYEIESMRWGFDPEDSGSSRVYYFDNVTELELAEFPEDLSDEYVVKEFDLTFKSQNSYPSFEELKCHSDIDCEWDAYDEALEKKKYEMESERHKLLGYANLIQGQMLTECERATRGIYCGTPESYQKLSDDEKENINKAAEDWILLFQMATVQDEDYELMFGDVGNIYFYIRKQDLRERNFDKVWLILQC